MTIFVHAEIQRNYECMQKQKRTNEILITFAFSMHCFVTVVCQISTLTEFRVLFFPHFVYIFTTDMKYFPNILMFNRTCCVIKH